jgi:hypothetical protein
MPRGEEALAEVTGDYFFLTADSSEVYAGIPATKDIDVRRYVLKLSLGQSSRFLSGPSTLFGMTRIWAGGKKRLEQFGDAGGLHGFDWGL